MGKAWKDFEKQVAEFFDGCRVVRIAYNEVAGDVIHPYYSIECKYGGQVPRHLAPRIPTELSVGERKFLVVPSQFIEIQDKMLYYQTLGWRKKRVKHSRFLMDALAQAERYNPTLRPLVCVKPRRRHGFVCIWERIELEEL